MDILIPHSWLRDYLKTKATPKQIAKYLSLCGPSVERINYIDKEPVYLIEVTTNRVDCAGVYGISKEAAAILPRFGLKTKLIKTNPVENKRLKKTVPYLKAIVDKTLCGRFTAVLVKNVKVAPSPKWMQERLKLVGVRPINNVVDISNYVMHELAQPVHTFDYDKIKGKTMVLRESKKGERLTTLDGKLHNLNGGDIVIEDGKGRLIDLAGIMGGGNSAVDQYTRNVLLFVQTYNPVRIRKTSMGLAQRSEAAVLFEKGLDPELVSIGIKKGMDLFIKLKAGRPVSQILDIYPNFYKPKKVDVEVSFINKRLGIHLAKSEISKILSSLGFDVLIASDTLIIKIPSYRASDINIPEDIVEEVARIYGYDNLPSQLMTGIIPDPILDAPFEFETKIKTLLSGWGGVEIYTQSLVPKTYINSKALKLKNPLGKEGEYLRTSLAASVVNAADANRHIKEAFHLFEIANVYLPKIGNLPYETMILAGVSTNTDYQKGRGIVEALLQKLNTNASFIQEEEKGFSPAKHVNIKAKGKKIGHIGILDNGYIYYEFEVEALRKAAIAIKSFKPISKFPPQIEDITFKLPEKTKIGEVMTTISSVKLVNKIELRDIYDNSYTFRVWYQNPEKTLTDKEVEFVRNLVKNTVEKKHGGSQT